MPKKKNGYCWMVDNLPGWDVTAEELLFLKAMDQYQRAFARRYPTYTEILFVARCLGYRKVAPAVPVPRRNDPLPTFPDADAHAPPADDPK